MPFPLLTFQTKQEIAAAYRAGLAMPALAERYGVAVNVIHRALLQLGVPRRDPRAAAAANLARLAEEALSPCRECGAGCHPNAVRPLCPVCARRFCQRCDMRLPKGEAVKTRLCHDCKFEARYQDRGPRLCRICGRMGVRGTKRPLCGVHIAWFCQVCEAPLPPGRVNRRCTECEGEKKQRLWERKGRRCAGCGEREAKVHSCRCQHCLHEEYEVQRWALLHLDRPCRECGAPLPRGRRLPRCGVCQRKVERRRRLERQQLGAHRCAMCHDPLPLSRATYCGGCHTMIANWRKAWHAGNKVARQLGTVRTPRRWQQDP